MDNDAELEVRLEATATQLSQVFNRYIKRFQKKHPDIAMPVLLNVCSRLAVGAVLTFPEDYQQVALKEFAALVARRYSLARSGLSPETSKVITLN